MSWIPFTQGRDIGARGTAVCYFVIREVYLCHCDRADTEICRVFIKHARTFTNLVEAKVYSC